MNEHVKSDNRSNIVGCVLGFVVLGLLMILLLPDVQSRRPSTRTMCANHLKQIVIALHAYHAANGMLPPAATLDSNGKPLHSWRTLLLPYLDQKPLFERIRLNEPWNSPYNIQFAKSDLPIYACPKTKTGLAYLAVRTRGGMFDGPTPRPIVPIDPASLTVIVIEVPTRPISWMQPTDFEEHDLDNVLTNGLRSEHSGGTNAGMADGSIRFLAQTIKPELFQSLLTRDGGEPVQDADLE
jgi:prepilin-type processing-associated H-X9-DG protein